MTNTMKLTRYTFTGKIKAMKKLRNEIADIICKRTESFIIWLPTKKNIFKNEMTFRACFNETELKACLDDLQEAVKDIDVEIKIEKV